MLTGERLTDGIVTEK